MADLKTRMKTVRALFHQHVGGKTNNAEYDKWYAECLASLRQAEKYFGFKKPTPPEDEAGREAYEDLLLFAMAQILFGKPGRGRQVKEWTDGKLHLLKFAHGLLRGRGLSDAQIAQQLCEWDPDRFGRDPERIRKLLPRAKRAVE